ncbi:MAG TPA: hypothetical protein VM621_07710 [Luteibacter sp.]|uniref:hypothetical protein n=1 Tax=Luteibacter sp. TaxID=1886636 RepID=UPI002CF5E962|nr:hypothetical protein [Luteibacter sp.]HVI54923.1 hypothetical protein [Luteibacter sp.]
MRVKVILALAAAAGGAAVYQASEWWERAYAIYVASEISPDGCFRIDTYTPFWVLPSMLHRSPDPDPAIRNSLGRPWDMAVFRRAYEISTGELLGETVVFDPVGPADRNYWNTSRTPGRRTVFANEFLLFDSDRCSDDATLAKLEAFYEQQREANRTIVNAWEEERRRANSPTGTGQ